MNKKMMSAVLALKMGSSVLAAGGLTAAAEEPVTVTWFTSRPVDGAIDQTMREISQKYSEEQGGNW